VLEYLGLGGVEQEFTCIEAYHRILKKEVFKKVRLSIFWGNRTNIKTLREIL